MSHQPGPSWSCHLQFATSWEQMENLASGGCTWLASAERLLLNPWGFLGVSSMVLSMTCVNVLYSPWVKNLVVLLLNRRGVGGGQA